MRLRGIHDNAKQERGAVPPRAISCVLPAVLILDAKGLGYLEYRTQAIDALVGRAADRLDQRDGRRDAIVVVGEPLPCETS
jgi:hypothetical protein